MTNGEAYAEQIDAHLPDRRARLAFRETVLRLLRPGSLIYDFGAGPGMDAAWYAQRGFRVLAYDVDPEMRAAFTHRCAPYLATRRVILHDGGYRQFLNSADADLEPVDGITANFAPLSLIDELPELFQRFHSLLKPGRPAIISVLNPYFAGDMKYRWWWQNAARLAMQGHYRVRSGAGYVHRRRPSLIAAAAAPYFALTSLVRGLPGPMLQRGPLRRLTLPTSQFMFMVFARCT